MNDAARWWRRVAARLPHGVDRYLVIGLLNTALDIGIYSALALAAHVPPVVANVVSTIIVMTMSFFLNRTWVFRSEVSGLAAFAQFAGVTLTTGLIVQSAVIWSVIGLAGTVASGVPDGFVIPAAKVIAVGVAMVVNFLAYRWIFAGSRMPRPRSQGS